MSREHRREDRYNVAVAASFRHGAGTSRAVRVPPLSARGCRFISADGGLGKGTFITLSFGRAGTLDARVKWRVGDAHGVRFDAPLEPALLDHIRLFLSEQPALVAEREPVTA
jgi:PilZ domain-containing protein